MPRFGGARGGGGFSGHARGFGRPRGTRIPNSRGGAHGGTYGRPRPGMPRPVHHGNYGCMGCVIPVIGVIVITAAVIAAVIGLI